MGRKKSKVVQQPERRRILLHGVRGCGVTSLVHWLRHGEAKPIPEDDSPVYFAPDDFGKYKDFILYHPNPGYGRCGRRPAIRFSYRGSIAIVYVIDSNQPDLMSQMIEELKEMMSNEYLKDIIFMAVANKQDLPGVKSPAELEEMFNKELTQPIKVFPTVATTGEGVNEGFDWLIDEIVKKREEEKALAAMTEPFKDVASDVKEQGKMGMKMAKEAWKKLSGIFCSKIKG